MKQLLNRQFYKTLNCLNLSLTTQGQSFPGCHLFANVKVVAHHGVYCGREIEYHNGMWNLE